MILVVMGVSGSGKTSVGQALAERLGARFLDADALHPSDNVTKMSGGTPLDDLDRGPWIGAVAAEIAAADAAGEDLVVACSALRRRLRELLREAAPVRFVHLSAAQGLLRERLDGRRGHFMPAALLDTQLAALEPPQGEPDVVTLDASLSVAELVAAAAAWARQSERP